MGRVRLRTSTKQRSMALVVRSLRHSGCGKGQQFGQIELEPPD